MQMYVGSFIIDSTGEKSITGVGFQPTKVLFRYCAGVRTKTTDETRGSNVNNVNCYAGSGFGFARDDGGGSTTQQTTHSGGSGNSINANSYQSSNSHCIFVRYGGQNGENVGDTSASFTSFDADGFTLNVDNKDDNLLVIYEAYGPTVATGKTYKLTLG